MPINFGALLTGATRGLSGYREGQRLGREDKRAEDAALFSEWAKRQELLRRDQELAAREEANRSLAGYREDMARVAGDKATTAAELAEIRRKIAEQGSWAEQARLGPNGTVDRTIAGNVGMNDQDNQFARAIALIRASSQREPEQWVVRTGEDGQEYRVNLRTGEKQPLGIKAPPSASASRFTAQQQTRIGDELGDLADIVVKAKSVAKTFEDRGLGNTTGWIRGTIGPALEQVGLVPDRQVKAVANMENVGSAVRLARSGTAVSKYELENLGFIPTKKMPEKGVALRAGELASNAERLLLSKIEMYEAMGIDMSGVRAKLQGLQGGPPPPPPPGGNTRPPLDSFADTTGVRR